MGDVYIIPPQSFPPKPNGVASTPTLNNAARANEWQCSSIAALGAVIPLIYGYDRVGARYIDCFSVGGTIWLVALWCIGSVESLDKIETSGGEALPANIVMRHYLGAQTAPDTRLANAFKSAGRTVPPTALTGCCYTVMEVPSATVFSPDGIVAYIKGRKVFDPRDHAQQNDLPSTWKWSDNAALCLADFLGNFQYGYRRRVLQESVITVADINDELLDGTERRRTLNLAICDKQEATTLIEALRTYAGCFVIAEGDVLRLVADVPGEVVHTFRQADVIGVPQRNGRGIRQAPTVVCVNYSNTTATPWKTASAYAYAPGVKEGIERYVESVVALPGINSYSAAMREAVERLNKLRLGDLEITATVADIGVLLQAGDLLSIWHPTTPDGKIYRLLESPRPNDDGNWQIIGYEYQPTMYSDDVFAQPVYGDTTLPDPANPPAPMSLVLEEELFPLADRTMKSRIRATWSPVDDFPYQKSYFVEVWSNNRLMESGNTDVPTYTTSVVEEGVHYIVRVATRTSIFSSDFIAGDIVALGKEMPPPDVERLTIQQVANWVLFSWTRVVDIDAIKRYQIRRWPLSGSWETGTIIDEPDMLAYRSNSEPAGIWNYGIVAIDQSEHPSKSPKVVQFRVAPDNSAYFVDENQYSVAILTNMFAWITRDGVTHYSTNHGDAWAALFPLSMENYPLPVNAYHGGGESSLVTEWWDIGVAVDGQYTVLADVDTDDGVVHVWLETSMDMVMVESHGGGSARTRARFCRVRFSTEGAMTVHGLPRVVITADPRVEAFSGVSSAVGPVIVTLVGRYFGIKDCSVSPQGADALLGIAANFQLSETEPNTFEVRVFNSATNQQVAVPFTGTFSGISY